MSAAIKKGNSKRRKMWAARLPRIGVSMRRRLSKPDRVIEVTRLDATKIEELGSEPFEEFALTPAWKNLPEPIKLALLHLRRAENDPTILR